MTALARPLRASAIAFAALTALSAAPAASAQSVWNSGVSASKSAAILGGAPSALEAILSQQGAKPARSAIELQPAGFRAPLIRPVYDLNDRADDDALSGRPDVFGSVALKVDRTRLDWRWSAVRQAAVQGRDRAFANTLRSVSARERAERVNQFVNHAVTFVEDRDRFGRPDVWSKAAETLRGGRGDCEDYAIAKYQLLRAAGTSADDLYLVIVKDLVRRQDHAVLVMRDQDHFLLLDNGTDVVSNTSEVRDYRPVLTFASNGAWTHGYRIKRQPVMTIAAADTKDSISGRETAELNQRSRSASLLAFNTGFNK